MRSPAGFAASVVFLAALPLAALGQMLLGLGAVVIHGALALGSAVMSFAVFDFNAPRWAGWVASISTAVLAGVFLLQGLSELTGDRALTHVAFQVLGQGLEGRLVEVFMAWGVLALVVDRRMRSRVLGVVALAAFAGVEVYGRVLAWQGTSLDAQAPILKALWLLPFVWLLFESARPRGLVAP